MARPDRLLLATGRRVALLLAVGLLVSAPAAAQPASGAKAVRTALILPYAGVDLSRDEQWIGAGVAESLRLSLVHVATLVQVDVQRLRGLREPEAWDEQAALAAARATRADVVLYGEVRRQGSDLVLHPRLLDVRGERRETLESVPAAEGKLLEALRALPVAYAALLRLPLTEAEAARIRKAAATTASLRAFEAFVRGRTAALRGTQEANESAVELLARAVELDPQFVAAQFALGQVHQALGNRWKAAAQFRASTQLDPTYPEPYKALGDLFVTAPRRLFDQAIEAYTKAIELRSFYADAWVGLGDARAAKGEVDAAVTAYQRALSHNPHNPRVHVSLGKLYYAEKGLYYESVQAYKKAIDLAPEFVEARLGLAEVYEDKGLYQEAISEYRRVVDLDPKHTGALYNLALVYEKVDPRESIALWERYIQLAGSLPSEKDWVDVARLHLRKLKNQLEKGQ